MSTISSGSKSSAAGKARGASTAGAASVTSAAGAISATSAASAAGATSKASLARNSAHAGGQLIRFIKSPKGYLMIALLLFTVLSMIGSGSAKGLINIIAAVVAAVCFDILMMNLMDYKPKFPDGAILTGLIVALVLSPAFPWYLTVLTSGIAIVTKHVLSVRRKPIFNPAAMGLFISIFLFSSAQSWWGGLSDLPVWSLAFVLVGGFIIMRRTHKFPQVVSFLIAYLLLLLAISIVHPSQVVDLYRVPYINSALFMAFFMLTDPPTSPAKSSEQILFGAITAVISVLAYLKFGALSYLFIGLLAANLLNALKVMLKR